MSEPAIDQPVCPAVAPVFKPKDAARYLGCGVRTLWQWTHDGLVKRLDLPGVRAVRYHKADLDAFLDRCREVPSKILADDDLAGSEGGGA